LLPFRRTVVISTAVELPFAEVERAAHICLADLVESAFAAREAMTRPGGGSVDAPVARVIQVPVEVEVRSVHRRRPWLLAHVRWQARGVEGSFP